MAALSLSSGAAEIDFESAARYSRANGGGTLIVWQRGHTLSDSANGTTPATPVNVFSITKSLTAMAWLSRFSAEEMVQVSSRDGDQLRASYLLSQTSGISPGARSIYRKNVKDIRSAALRLPRSSSPGAVFAYGPSHYELIGSRLQQEVGSGQNAVDAILLRRLGVKPGAWTTDARGIPFYSAGAFLSALDLLKIGRLILDSGRVGIFHPLISQNRMAAALTGSPANPAYGLGFWLNSQALRSDARELDIEQALALELSSSQWRQMCLSKAAPADLVCMAGSNGQRVYVSRSRHLVVVRTGRSSRFRDPDFLRILFRSPAR